MLTAVGVFAMALWFGGAAILVVFESYRARRATYMLRARAPISDAAFLATCATPETLDPVAVAVVRTAAAAEAGVEPTQILPTDGDRTDAFVTAVGYDWDWDVIVFHVRHLLRQRGLPHRVPEGILLACGTAEGAARVLTRWLRAQEPDAPSLAKVACPKCGYDLRGHTGPRARCPECGAVHDLDALLIDPTPGRTVRRRESNAVVIAAAVLMCVVGLAVTPVNGIAWVISVGGAVLLLVKFSRLDPAHRKMARTLAWRSAIIALAWSGAFIGAWFAAQRARLSFPCLALPTRLALAFVPGLYHGWWRHFRAMLEMPD